MRYCTWMRERLASTELRSGLSLCSWYRNGLKRGIYLFKEATLLSFEQLVSDYNIPRSHVFRYWQAHAAEACILLFLSRLLNELMDVVRWRFGSTWVDWLYFVGDDPKDLVSETWQYEGSLGGGNGIWSLRWLLTYSYKKDTYKLDLYQIWSATVRTAPQTQSVEK